MRITNSSATWSAKQTDSLKVKVAETVQAVEQDDGVRVPAQQLCPILLPPTLFSSFCIPHLPSCLLRFSLFLFPSLTFKGS